MIVIATTLMRWDKQKRSYLQFTGDPLTVYIFSPEQVQVLKTRANLDNIVVLHLDATGSVLRQPTPESKRVYYYARVIQTSNDVVLVLEFISSQNTATDIVALKI